MTADLATIAGIDAPTGLLIGGQWCGGRSGMLPVVNPATEGVLVEVADASPEDGLEAVGAAAAALPRWSATPPRQRGECLRTAYELMIQRSEQLARLMVCENGKALRDARGEIVYAAEFFRWYAEEAVRLDGSVSVAPSGANRILVVHQPVGISYMITPWNFPAAMATRKIGPALAAGCTAVLKPAKETPLTALAVAAILAEAGVPDGVVNVVPTSKPGPMTQAVLADPRVRKLSFTGSTEVGRTLLKQAADYVVNCSMELGGNAPFLVFEDADVDAAVEGAFLAKMRNGGEACTAANRFYVHEQVAGEFSAKLTARLSALKVGPGLEDDVELGPLVNADTRSKVAELVESATGDGAKVMTGGHAPDRVGYYYEPTVLDGVPPDAGILSEEIFGPVAPIVRFTDADQAIALANDTEYGLVSYLYCGDLARALRTAGAGGGHGGYQQGSGVRSGGAVRRSEAVRPGARRSARRPA